MLCNFAVFFEDTPGPVISWRWILFIWGKWQKTGIGKLTTGKPTNPDEAIFLEPYFHFT
jgi:hypothetical protein